MGIAYQQLELPKLAERYYKKAAKADKRSAIPSIIGVLWNLVSSLRRCHQTL